MIYVDQSTAQGVGRSLMQSGRLPQHAGYGRLAGVGTDLKNASMDLGSTYLANKGDVTSLFGPGLDYLSKFSSTLPPPFGQIAGFAAWAGGEGAKAVSGFLTRVAANCALWLSVEDSDKVVSAITGSPLTYWTAASKDKMVQEVNSSTMLKLTVSAWNAAVGKNNQLDVTQQGRLADLVYKLCTSEGADGWAAAMVAYTVATDSGATAAAKQYAFLVCQGTVDFDPAKAWYTHVKQTGGKMASAGAVAQFLAQQGKGDLGSGGSGGKMGDGLAIGAAALLGLYLLAK